MENQIQTENWLSIVDINTSDSNVNISLLWCFHHKIVVLVWDYQIPLSYQNQFIQVE